MTSPTGQASDRLLSLLSSNFKGGQILQVPEGEFRGWIPKVLYTLQLEELSIPFSKLMSFPIGGTSLGKLISMRALDMTGNNLHMLPNSFANCEQLERLILAFNNLTILPVCIYKLINLTELDISDNDITSLAPEIGDLVNLKSLNAGGNLMLDLPIELANCSQLKRLNLSAKWYPNGGFATVPEAVCRLVELVELDLSWHAIEVIPDGIGNLTKLQILNLKGNMLKSISKEISQCSELVTLNMTRAMRLLANVPTAVFSLTDLVCLDLTDNYFTEIPTEVFGLKKLRYFVMQKNALFRLPDQFFQLKNLEQIELSENYLETVPPAIKKLKKLRYLGLANNQLRSLPSEICECRSLTKLVLSSNQLEKIPGKIYKLSNLEELSLQNNNLKTLPLLLDRLEKLSETRHLYLFNNQLTKPPQEICDQGVAALYQYLQEIRISEANHRRKMILIGAEKAGKTSLRNAMILGQSKLTAEHERTWVLERHLWEPEDNCRIQVLDFGGHHIYSAAHHMFLTPEALHIIVFDFTQYDCTDDEFDHRVGNWIEAVTDRAPGASIMFVGTHADLCTDDEIKSKSEDILKRVHAEENEKLTDMSTELETWQMLLNTPEARESFGGKFTNIEVERVKDTVAHLKKLLHSRVPLPQSIFAVSCAEDLFGVDEFRIKLLKTLQDAEEKPLPTSWHRFLLEIQKRPEKILSWAETVQIFETVMDELKQSMMTISGNLETSLTMILKYFTATGEIVWYLDNPKLSRIIFHRPETLIEMLRAIFRHDYEDVMCFDDTFGKIVGLSRQTFEMVKEEFLKHGLMSLQLLQFTLHHFNLSIDALDTFVSLMLMFDLCYEVPTSLSAPMLLGQKVFLCPWRLTKEQPSDLENLWPSLTPANTIEFRMVLKFQRKGPPNFFEKLSVRMQNHIFDRMDWKDGIFARKNNTKLLLCREKQNSTLDITLSVRGSDILELWSLILRPRQEMRSLLAEWPCARVDISSVCPHCILTNEEVPFLLPGDIYETRCPAELLNIHSCQNAPEVSIPACFIYPLDSDFEDEINLPKHLQEVSEFLGRTRASDNTGLLSDMGLYFVASRLGLNWEMIAVYLSVPQEVVERAKMDNQHSSLHQIFTALKHWRDNMDTIDGTDVISDEDKVEQLLKALEESEKIEFVEELCSIYHIER